VRLSRTLAATLPLIIGSLAPAASSALEDADLAAARAAVEERRELFGAGRGVELGAGRVRRHLARSVATFEVLADGLPVFFRSITIQLGPDGTPERRAGAGLGDSAVVAPHPDRRGRGAVEWALGEGAEPAVVIPGWLHTPAGLRPVVRVDMVPANSLDGVSVYLDASDRIPIHREPMAMDADPLGAVFRENPVTTPEVEIVPLTHLDVSKGSLYGDYARVERCVDLEECTETAVHAAPDAEGNYAFEPQLDPYTHDDPFCEVNVYNNITRMSAWARDTFGWDGLFDGETRILVKVGIAWYNAAFFSGNDEVAPYIIFGQDVIDMGYDADVAFHEFGHAINRSIRSHPWFVRDLYGTDVAPFGIEEGMADIWAEHFSGDPVMNSYVLPSRTASNSLVCPDDLRAEGHMEARIISAAGWDIRERVGPIAWQHIFYRTLFFLAPEAGFGDFIEELARSAEDLAQEADSGVSPGDADIVMEEGLARGLLDPDCSNRFVPLAHGVPARAYGYGRERTNARDRPFGLQWKLVAGPETAAVRLLFSWRYPGDAEPGYRVHVSRGKPVEITWLDPADVEEGKPEFLAAADVTVDGAPGRVDYPVVGLAPLAAGEEIYVLLSSDTEEPTVVVDVEALHLSSLPIPAWQGTPAADEEPTAGSWSPSCEAARGGTRPARRPVARLISLLLNL